MQRCINIIDYFKKKSHNWEYFVWGKKPCFFPIKDFTQNAAPQQINSALNAHSGEDANNHNRCRVYERNTVQAETSAVRAIKHQNYISSSFSVLVWFLNLIPSNFSGLTRQCPLGTHTNINVETRLNGRIGYNDTLHFLLSSHSSLALFLCLTHTHMCV